MILFSPGESRTLHNAGRWRKWYNCKSFIKGIHHTVVNTIPLHLACHYIPWPEGVTSVLPGGVTDLVPENREGSLASGAWEPTSSHRPAPPWLSSVHVHFHLLKSHEVTADKKANTDRKLGQWFTVSHERLYLGSRLQGIKRGINETLVSLISYVINRKWDTLVLTWNNKWISKSELKEDSVHIFIFYSVGLISEHAEVL